MLELDIHDRGSKQDQILVYWHMLAQSTVTNIKDKWLKEALSQT